MASTDAPSWRQRTQGRDLSKMESDQRPWRRGNDSRGQQSFGRRYPEVEGNRPGRMVSSGPTHNSGATKQAWSKMVWGGRADRGALANSESSENSGGVSSEPANKHIGLGRATGFRRTADVTLSNSPDRMHQRLTRANTRLQQLEHDGFAVEQISGEIASGKTPSSDEIAKVWEPLLAEYRQLTMAVTASTCSGVQDMGIKIYESAADACLLAGNLSFYLSCQTRLLALYHECMDSPEVCRRKLEFSSYAMLYFGVFCVDHIELSRIMRAMTREGVKSPYFKFAFSAVSAFTTNDGVRFISFFRRASLRQRIILCTAREAMKSSAMSQLTTAYMSLEKGYARSLLGGMPSEDFLGLIRAKRPDLLECNSDESAEYKFRVHSTR